MNPAEDTITVYYSTQLYDNREKLYTLSKLFSDYVHKQNKENSQSFLACPAVSNHLKKILVVNSLKDSKHDIESNNVVSNNDNSYDLKNVRPKSIQDGFTFEYQTPIIFFADQPLDAIFTSPYFHKAGYTEYASLIPGKWNVGQWFRPFNFEVQFWNEDSKIVIKDGEPLFYVNFLTDKKIIMKEFKQNEKLDYYSQSLTKTTPILKGKGLQGRYNLFNKNNIKSKILKEINDNLLDTPYIIL
jgi:hypothetical protein